MSTELPFTPDAKFLENLRSFQSSAAFKRVAARNMALNATPARAPTTTLSDVEKELNKPFEKLSPGAKDAIAEALRAQRGLRETGYPTAGELRRYLENEMKDSKGTPYAQLNLDADLKVKLLKRARWLDAVASKLDRPIQELSRGEQEALADKIMSLYGNAEDIMRYQTPQEKINYLNMMVRVYQAQTPYQMLRFSEEFFRSDLLVSTSVHNDNYVNERLLQELNSSMRNYYRDSSPDGARNMLQAAANEALRQMRSGNTDPTLQQIATESFHTLGEINKAQGNAYSAGLFYLGAALRGDTRAKNELLNGGPAPGKQWPRLYQDIVRNPNFDFFQYMNQHPLEFWQLIKDMNACLGSEIVAPILCTVAIKCNPTQFEKLMGHFKYFNDNGVGFELTKVFAQRFSLGLVDEVRKFLPTLPEGSQQRTTLESFLQKVQEINNTANTLGDRLLAMQTAATTAMAALPPRRWWSGEDAAATFLQGVARASKALLAKTRNPYDDADGNVHDYGRTSYAGEMMPAVPPSTTRSAALERGTSDKRVTQLLATSSSGHQAQSTSRPMPSVAAAVAGSASNSRAAINAAAPLPSATPPATKDVSITTVTIAPVALTRRLSRS